MDVFAGDLFETVDGKLLEVVLDPWPESPRTTWDNLGTFYTWTHSYESPDMNPYKTLGKR